MQTNVALSNHSVLFPVDLHRQAIFSWTTTSEWRNHECQADATVSQRLCGWMRDTRPPETLEQLAVDYFRDAACSCQPMNQSCFHYSPEHEILPDVKVRDWGEVKTPALLAPFARIRVQCWAYTGVIFHEVVGRGRLFFKQSIYRSVRLFQVKPPYKTTGQPETDRQTDRQTGR